MFISFLKGLCLGGVAYTIGFIMDITISKKSFNDIIANIPLLYQQALNKIQINMLVISPAIYTAIDHYLLDHNLLYHSRLARRLVDSMW